MTDEDNWHNWSDAAQARVAVGARMDGFTPPTRLPLGRAAATIMGNARKEHEAGLRWMRKPEEQSHTGHTHPFKDSKPLTFDVARMKHFQFNSIQFHLFK